MPSSSTEGERSISTSAKRASYCSLRLLHEARPVRGARDDALAAPQTSGSRCRCRARSCRRGAKNRSNSSRTARVEQDRLRPALAGPEHVAVGEAAAGHQSLELFAASAARRAGRSCARRAARSRRASNTAAVSTWLLTPCSRRIATARPHAARDVRRGDVLLRIEAQRDATGPGSRRVGAARRIPRRAHCGIIAQPAHAPGGLRPGALQVRPGLVELAPSPTAHAARASRSLGAPRCSARCVPARAVPGSRANARLIARHDLHAPRPAPRRTAAPSAAPRAAGSAMSRPQCPANAISSSVTNRPPSERS